MKIKVVSLVGADLWCRDGADLRARDGELWGINNIFRSIRRASWTRWFEMHADDYLRQYANERWQWCKQLKIPCYMLKREPDIPASRSYPRDAVNDFLKKRFGSEPDYFTSSFSYMVALAIFEGFSEIRLHGVAMSDHYELALERPGLEYLIGLARGSGIKVVVSPASPLLYTRWPYGYEEPRLTIRRARDAMRLLRGVAGNGLKPTKIRELKAHYIWLKTYAKPGLLMRKDGRVN